MCRGSARINPPRGRGGSHCTPPDRPLHVPMSHL